MLLPCSSAIPVPTVQFPCLPCKHGTVGTAVPRLFTCAPFQQPNKGERSYISKSWVGLLPVWSALEWFDRVKMLWSTAECSIHGGPEICWFNIGTDRCRSSDQARIPIRHFQWIYPVVLNPPWSVSCLAGNFCFHEEYPWASHLVSWWLPAAIFSFSLLEPPAPMKVIILFELPNRKLNCHWAAKNTTT